MKQTDVLIAIDGGATSTSCVVSSEMGHVLWSHRFGSLNQGHGTSRTLMIKETMSTIITELRHLVRNRGLNIVGLCVGLSGSRVGGHGNVLKAMIEEGLQINQVIVVSDMDTVFESASGGDAAIVIYAGTGSVCIGRNERNEWAKTGGWGYMVDDQGGAFSIGQSALKAAFRDYDGRGQETLLTHRVLQYYGEKSFEQVCSRLYNEEISPSEIGHLAPLVSSVAQSGDPVALGIFKNAGEELALHVEAVARKLGYGAQDKLCVYHSGGVFESRRLIIEPMSEYLKGSFPRHSVGSPCLPAELGGLILVYKNLLGKDPKETDFLPNLARTFY